MNASETSSRALRLSVIVPAYNEAGRIGPTLHDIQSYLSGRDYSYEVLVIDDGSRDDTGRIARQAWQGEGLRILRQEPNQGKGAAIQRGMAEARGQWRLFTDADNSTPIEEIEKFWPRAEQGFDICIASRALAESNLEVRQPFYREMMGRTFNLFVRALAIGGIHDTQCGFKMFSGEAAEAIFPRMKLRGWAFDVECLMIGRGLGYRIAEVPVRWLNSPATRVSAISDSMQMFRDLWQLRTMYGRNGRKLRGTGNGEQG